MKAATVERIVLAALVVAESAWVYGLLAIIGIGLGGGGAPLSWLAVLSVLAVSAIVAGTLQAIALSDVVRYGVQMTPGALVIYLVVASHVANGHPFLDLGWVGNLFVEGQDGRYIQRGVVGSIAAVVLWRRGGRMATADSLPDALGFSFRLGAFFLGLAVIVDLVSETDVHTFPILFLFFATALAGLGAGRLAQGSERSAGAGPWLKVVAAIVVAVLLLGLLLSLLRKENLAFLTGPATVVLDWIGKGIFYAFIVPLSYVVNAIVSWVAGFFREGTRTQTDPPVSFGEQFLNQPETGTPTYVTVVEWLLLALVVGVVLYFLARAFQRRRRLRFSEAQAVRESVREGADPTYDLGSLLFDLLPPGLKRRRVARRVAIPGGPPGIAQALRAYYRLLLWAEERGLRRQDHETPSEYQARAAAKLSSAPVAETTDAFNVAFYGGHPTLEDRLSDLHSRLDELGAPDVAFEKVVGDSTSMH
jgi:hypothetical protein